jgi:uncharacterized membrane protein
MNIPDEAVEAALIVLRRDDLWDYSDEEECRLILEAAAPYLMAQALREAADYLDGEFAEGRAAQRKSFDWLCGIADAEAEIRARAASIEATE